MANVIGIMVGWRALAAYFGNLRGAAMQWDKTTHSTHPADSPARALAEPAR